MSYKIKIRTHDEPIIVDEARGTYLKDTLLNPVRPQFLEIDGNLYRLSEIVSIEQFKPIQFPQPVQEELTGISNHRDMCKGKYSIQKEINRITKEEHPTEWAKLIQDKKWRESIRQKLRETPAQWCDYKAHECACKVQ